ncbi:hypothetical protein FACS1894216_15060 [Synergistales bacterium]|nr:hypothetical protein FACS1894216_15060 [Synergistales bacterium]
MAGEARGEEGGVNEKPEYTYVNDTPEKFFEFPHFLVRRTRAPLWYKASLKKWGNSNEKFPLTTL